MRAGLLVKVKKPMSDEIMVFVSVQESEDGVGEGKKSKG